MLSKANVFNGISEDTVTGNKKGVVFVFSDYRPAPYPDDVVNYRHVIIHEELPENTCGGTELHVFVRKVNSPSEFWINLYGFEYSRKLVDLYGKMRNFYEEKHNMYLLPSYAVRVNQFCVCVYKNEWFRVRIIKATDKHLVDVFLIDCGSYITVNPDNLRFMHKMFADLPIQSFRADIPGIKPKNSAEWPASVCEFFRQETCGKKLCAKVVNVAWERHALSLNLLDVTGTSISEKILSSNMAKNETQDLDSSDAAATVDSNLGASFVKIENIIGIPEDTSSHASDDSMPEEEEAGSRTGVVPVSWRNVDHKDVIITGKRLLLVRIREKYYFILSDFLQAFAMLHEHVVLKLLEAYPNRMLVEKMDYKELRVLLDGLRGRHIRGMTHLADRGVIPSVHLVPVKVACELLSFLGEDGPEKIVLQNFVSSLL